MGYKMFYIEFGMSYTKLSLTLPSQDNEFHINEIVKYEKCCSQSFHAFPNVLNARERSPKSTLCSETLYRNTVVEKF